MISTVHGTKTRNSVEGMEEERDVADDRRTKEGRRERSVELIYRPFVNERFGPETINAFI